MLRRALLLLIVLGLAQPVAAGGGPSAVVRDDLRPTTALSCPAVPARMQRLLEGKHPCGRSPQAPALPVGSAAGPTGPLSCGLPGDTAPRCPTSADDLDPGAAYAVNVLASPDGKRAYVVGTPPSGSTNVVITYDLATGKRVRTSTVRLPGNSYAYDAEVSPDGRHLLAGGRSSGSSSGVIAYLVDLASGKLVWKYTEPARTNYYDAVHSVAFDGQSGRALLAIAKKEKAGAWTDDWVATALDRRTGRPLWRHQFGKRDGTDQYPTSSGYLRGGRWLVVGTQQSGQEGRTDYAAVARTYDVSTGALLDTRVYDGPGDASTAQQEGWWDLAVSGDGRQAAMVGSASDYRLTGEGLVAVTDGTGRQRWLRTVASAGASDTQAYGVSWAADRVLVAADATVTPPLDYLSPAYTSATSLVVALRPTDGSELWRTNTGGPGNTWASTITALPDGSRVYAAGTASPAFVYAYASTGATTAVGRAPGDAYLAALDGRTGKAIWTSRYNHAATGTDYSALFGVAATRHGVLSSGFTEKVSTRYVGSSYVYPAQPYGLVLRHDQ